MEAQHVEQVHKKLHVILLVNGEETVSFKTVTLDDTDSVSQALRDIGADAKIHAKLEDLKCAVRFYDGKVFVDNRSQALWLLGHIEAKPDDADSHVVNCG